MEGRRSNPLCHGMHRLLRYARNNVRKPANAKLASFHVIMGNITDMMLMF